jgi:SAM-dependent methyltransferase
MSNELIEVKYCPVCGWSDKMVTGNFQSKPLVSVDAGFSMLTAGVMVKYDRCLHCGLIFQNPRMSDESIKSFYADGHYRNITGNQDTDEKGRAERIANTLDMIPTRHLDIGCSRGYLLQKTKELFNCGVQGVDENPEYAVEGIPTVKNLELVWGDFDLITMIHVLEHVTDPINELLKLRPFLRANGTLLIEVPSMNSKGGPWRLAHLYHFEPWVLVDMLRIAGYKVKDVKVEEHTLVEATLA